MPEPIAELEGRSRVITDEDLQRIITVTGEGSNLHQLALDQSPDFIPELEKFLSTNRFARMVQDQGEETEAQPLPPITYVNPEFIAEGLRHIVDLKHLMKLYEERTGNQTILMQTDYPLVGRTYDYKIER